MLRDPRLWLWGGVAAPILYLVAVVLGGILTPGYSHVAGPVSALVMTGAPAALALIPLFALYNALLMGFAFAVRDALQAEGVNLGLLAPVALAVLAILGVLMLVYPMDPLGAPTDEGGRLHLFLAGVSSFATMAAVLFTARAFREAGWKRLAIYSYVSLVVIAATGLWAANTLSEMSPWMGLAERLTIGAFLQWLFVVALVVVQTPRSFT